LQVANNLVRELEDNAEPGKGPVLVVTTETEKEANPLLKHLDANTSSAKTKIFDTWKKIKKDHSVSESECQGALKKISVSMAQNYKEHPIIILIDEIIFTDKMLNSLAEPSESFPANVTIIAVVNPLKSHKLPTLPESVLQINLTTPYRSTIAITSLARFLAKGWGLDFPEGEFGSDVKGKKPIAFDVGGSLENLKMALQRSREQLGGVATLLHDLYGLPSSMKEICESHKKEKGGPWECYDAVNFYGWEAERVVAVTTGWNTLEMTTRAKRELILILAKPEKEIDKKKRQVIIKAAADEGLLDLQVIKSENQIENAATEDVSQTDVDDESKNKVMKNENTPVRVRKILVAKRRIKKPVKENDILQHTDKGLIDVEVVTSEIEKLELQNNNKNLDDLIKSENQIENAATEDGESD